MNDPTITMEEYPALIERLNSDVLQTSIEAALTLLVARIVDGPDSKELPNLAELSILKSHTDTLTLAVTQVTRIDELDKSGKSTELRQQFETVFRDMLVSEDRQVLANVVISQTEFRQNIEGYLLVHVSQKQASPAKVKNLTNRLSELRTDLKLEAAANLLQHVSKGSLQEQRVIDCLRPHFNDQKEITIQGGSRTATAAELAREVLQQNGIDPSAAISASNLRATAVNNLPLAALAIQNSKALNTSRK